ncbi:MAG: hypothetical protein ACREKS_11965, partial [Candidatus Rokuibacteriota bacterium]
LVRTGHAPPPSRSGLPIEGIIIPQTTEQLAMTAKGGRDTVLVADDERAFVESGAGALEERRRIHRAASLLTVIEALGPALPVEPLLPEIAGD